MFTDSTKATVVSRLGVIEEASPILGDVVTPLGIVSVDGGCVGGHRGVPVHYVTLDFVYGGRHHSRYIERVEQFTRRGLTTMATRFAREMVKETP
jgi:hypothetical protein